MSVDLQVIPDESLQEAVAQLEQAAAAKKCWPCGCLHHSLDAIERAIAPQRRPPELVAAIQTARSRLTDVKYDCLGCEVCWPPLAMNALKIDGEACPTEEVEARPGWPPLAGSYTALRYHAPVGVCTLTNEGLSRAIANAANPNVAIVGTCQTENLGLERLIQNVLANPNIRFLIVCGADSRQAIGHLPGQSLVALARSGTDVRARIIGAWGRRPVLRNIDREAIEHFRRTVEVVDLVALSDAPAVIRSVDDCAARNPGPAPSLASQRVVTTVCGHLPERMIPDPAGYFVVYVDGSRRLLSLEHYRNDGVLDVVIEGRVAAELYTTVVERGLISRLDHAAYLGRELARAERAMTTGAAYVQEGAPEACSEGPGGTCACSSSCEGETA